MNHRIYLLITILCLLLATACSYRIFINAGWQPTCVPLSILNAWTAGQHGHQVRIAVTKIDAKTDHSQAQALIDGEWTPLSERWTGQYLLIEKSKKHFPVEPYRYLGLEEWIQEQLQYAKPKEE